ncbi:hypothetical protein [Vibrio parahaemolyticus]
MTYTPDDNYVGKDTFTYVVTSGGVLNPPPSRSM